MDDRRDQFVDVRTAGEVAGVHVETVRRWINEGRLTRYQTGTGRVRVAWSELTFICEPRPANDSDCQ